VTESFLFLLLLLRFPLMDFNGSLLLLRRLLLGWVLLQEEVSWSGSPPWYASFPNSNDERIS